MATRDTLGFKVDDETKEAVDKFQDRHGYDTRSKALEELVKTGLRESSHPILERWLDTIYKSTYYLALTSLVLIVIGAYPGIINPQTAVSLAAILGVIALALLAINELTRVTTGQSRLKPPWRTSK